MIFELKRDDRIFIEGRSGSGKTTLAKELIRKNQDKDFFIIDILGNYFDLDQYENTAIFMIDPLDESKLNKIIEIGLQRGAFFVIDEFHAFPFLKYKSLRFLILAGRNRGSGWIAITQFPALVPKSVIGNANISFLFSNYEKNAVKYLSSTYEVTEQEIRSLTGHYFYMANYQEIVRDENGVPVKFIL